MARFSSDIPVLLFPLKIETRFIEVKEETNSEKNIKLWIRALPDEAFLQSHDNKFTEKEKDDALEYLSKNSKNEKLEGWNKLVTAYGTYRATFLAHLTSQELNDNSRLKSDSEVQSFYYDWLPEKLIFYIYFEGEKDPFLENGAIPEGNALTKDRLDILEGDDGWIETFYSENETSAVGAGFGKIIDVTSKKGKNIEKLIIAGFGRAKKINNDNAYDPSSSGLKELIRNHRFTEGFSILDYGTPTNNLGDLKSSFTIKDENEKATSFDSYIDREKLTKSEEGYKLAEAFKLPESEFQFVKNSNSKTPLLIDVFKRITWFSLGGRFLQVLLGDSISSKSQFDLWKHFSKNVFAKGPLPSVRIGEQPYGILPITNKEATKKNSRSISRKINKVLNELSDYWLSKEKNQNALINDVPRIGQNTDNHLLRLVEVLSQQPQSTEYSVRSLGYDKIHGKWNNWYEAFANIKVDLSNLPVTQIRELLGLGQSKEFNSNVEILSRFVSDKEIKYSPILNFTEKKVFEESLINEKLGGEVKDAFHMNLNTSRDNSDEILPELDALISVLDDIIEGDSDSIPWFKGKEYSLFTDLILSSYANAIQLFNKVVYFNPTSEQIKGGTSKLKVTSTSNDLTKPVILTGGITIASPLTGSKVKIAKHYVNTQTEVNAGDRLFRVVDETNLEKVKKEFISLFKDLKTFFESEEGKQIDFQKEALREALDLSSYRLDAWVTSLATHRLNGLKNDEKGIYIGAYGWVEDLKVDPAKATQEGNEYYDKNGIGDGGIIHTPDSDQSLTATLFKNAFLSHENKDEPNPYCLNLSSDRIQIANKFMSGIRYDQSVEALLGYQLERYIRENGDGDDMNEMYNLREDYPLEVNVVNRTDSGSDIGFQQLSVINGTKIIDAYEKNQSSFTGVIKDGIEKLMDTLDGSADSLFFEAGYQMTQGNLSQSSAAINAAKGDNDPPPISSVKTKIPGKSFRHKFSLIIPNINRNIANKRNLKSEFQNTLDYKSFFEPGIENWLKEQIGPMNKIGCVVELYEDDELWTGGKNRIPVKLSEINISYSDLLYLSDTPVNDGAGELELRIWNKIKDGKPEGLSYKITSDAPPNCQSLSDALEVAEYTYSLFSKCRPLRTEDLKNNEEEVEFTDDLWAALQNQKERLDHFMEALNGLKTNTAIEQSVEKLARLNIDAAKRTAIYGESLDINSFKNERTKKLNQYEVHANAFKELFETKNNENFYKAFEELREATRIWCGKGFILLSPALASDQFEKIISENRQVNLVGEPSLDPTQMWGQERVQQWVQQLAQVEVNVERFEEWQMVNSAWRSATGKKVDDSFTIIQGQKHEKNKTLVNYPWIGLDESQINKLITDKFGANDQYHVVDPIDEKLKPYLSSASDFYPNGIESMVVYSEQLDLKKGTKKIPQYGFLIEEFSEQIPDKEVDTGISFHYNGPNSEAPQALLLAVPPDNDTMTTQWKESDLRDMILHTMDLMKIRMVDPDIIRERFGGLLPLNYLTDIPKVN